MIGRWVLNENLEDFIKWTVFSEGWFFIELVSTYLVYSSFFEYMLIRDVNVIIWIGFYYMFSFIYYLFCFEMFSLFCIFLGKNKKNNCWILFVNIIIGNFIWILYVWWIIKYFNYKWVNCKFFFFVLLILN